MFASARKAAALISDPAFFWLVLKALGLTILLFAILFVALRYGIGRLPVRHTALVDALIPVVSSGLTLLLVMFLGAPVAALFASLFLEDIARSVEKRFYPNDPSAGGAPFWRSLLLGLRLFLLLMLLQLLLLPLNLLIGLGALLSLLVNGWFLGREYFELVALRHIPSRAVDEMRRRRASTITGAGLLIALLATIPLVNLVAPLFGVALMVHEFKRYAHEELRA
ncbi:MAG TPA: EI24 domain-containing protein [Rhizomicrobium sp.]|jgi:CysZ protein